MYIGQLIYHKKLCKTFRKLLEDWTPVEDSTWLSRQMQRVNDENHADFHFKNCGW